jgi:lon-related putative ATP-dependent protease
MSHPPPNQPAGGGAAARAPAPPARDRVTRLRPAGAAAEQLRRRCAEADVPFASTAEAGVAAPMFGQLRASETLATAAGMPGHGYNVFATGPPRTGKRAMLGDWLRERAASAPTPPDLVQLHNFDDPLRPHAVAIPTGSAKRLSTDVQALVEEARRSLAEAFESDSYRTHHRELHDEADRRRAEIIGAVEQRARQVDVALRLTPAGALTAPMSAGRPLKPDEMTAMPDAMRERYQAAVSELEEPVDAAFAAIRDIDREMRERHRALNRDVAMFAIGHLVEQTQRRWPDTPRIVAWLGGLREDATANLDRFRQSADAEGPREEPVVPGLPQLTSGREFFARYEVNVLVTHEPGSGAPVIVATDPSFHELFGRVEYEMALGAVTTDHRHLRAGLIHRASGGFLVLDAANLLAKPLAWPRLKDVLRTGRLKIENPAAQYMLFPGVSLEPEPVDIALTVVLVGVAQLYELLLALDEDVGRLFKLRADFDDEMPRDEAGVRAYAGLLAQVVRERGLPEFDRGAIAAIVEHGGRLAGHRERLSTCVRDLADIASEAAHVAAGERASAVGARHVAGALRARARRSDLVENRLRESTLEGTVHIDVTGSVIGQVNGIAVARVGEYEFGHPVRITATVAPGEGEVLDIDREARLSGPVHAKGVLILSGYLAGRYFLERPMSLRASIVFEQSYGPVEGDSASTAELLALLSALAGLPADQGVAITGAVDQHGAVHAVGAVNEKIEGFFDLCDAQGLTGGQGVVVPAANLRHLMLDERVVEAVRQRRFRVWPVRTVDEALRLVTGSETADARVRDRLFALSEAARAARAPLHGPR